MKKIKIILFFGIIFLQINIVFSLSNLDKNELFFFAKNIIVSSNQKKVPTNFFSKTKLTSMLNSKIWKGNDNSSFTYYEEIHIVQELLERIGVNSIDKSNTLFVHNDIFNNELKVYFINSYNLVEELLNKTVIPLLKFDANSRNSFIMSNESLKTHIDLLKTSKKKRKCEVKKLKELGYLKYDTLIVSSNNFGFFKNDFKKNDFENYYTYSYKFKEGNYNFPIHLIKKNRFILMSRKSKKYRVVKRMKKGKAYYNYYYDNIVNEFYIYDYINKIFIYIAKKDSHNSLKTPYKRSVIAKLLRQIG